MKEFIDGLSDEDAAEVVAAMAEVRESPKRSLRTMAKDPDLLDEIVGERRAKDPAFPALVEAAHERRRMLRRLTEDRIRLGLSQTAVAAEMGTSQSAVARIESGKADVKLSTLERYAATLGRRVEWHLEPAASAHTSVRAEVEQARREISQGKGIRADDLRARYLDEA